MNKAAPQKCRIHDLHPTQITVGMIEVHDKRRRLRGFSRDERQEYLEAHPIPAVLGAGQGLYLTDHHHLARALHDENFEHGWFLIEDDFSQCAPAEFWQRMQARQWVHPVDQHGRRHGPERLPPHIGGLADDPYRSLAGYVRNAGGFSKSDTAFAEFLWADFFRRHVTIGPAREDFEEAVQRALRLAHGPDAHGLPGYVAG